MSHRRYGPRRCLLVLKAEGGAELQEIGSDGTLWAADSDEDFTEEFGTGPLDEDDLEHVVEFLCDEGYLTDAEADRLEVEIDEPATPED
jgi:hypothetical protein